MVAKPAKNKKYFTSEQAEAMLPLVRSIVKDISLLSHAMRDRHARLDRLRKDGVVKGVAGHAHLEEEQAAWEKDAGRLKECIDELTELGVEMKDLFMGLVDFPCWKDDREICLCWKLGESSLEWWHETHTGFSGRQPLVHADCDMHGSL